MRYIYGSWFKFYLVLQGLAIKYTRNILLGTLHTQESRIRGGASLPLSALLLHSRKSVNLFQVLHLRQLPSIFNQSACNHQLCYVITSYENISARLGSAWHASVLDIKNIAVLKKLYHWYLIKYNFKFKENINNNLTRSLPKSFQKQDLLCI